MPAPQIESEAYFYCSGVHLVQFNVLKADQHGMLECELL